MLQLDNPFWAFSLAVYAKPCVAEECIALQDRLSIDVNVLLFCAWTGAELKVQLDDDSFAIIDGVIANWREAVVRPLRATRRSLRQLPSMSAPPAAALYKDILAAELKSEQIEQALLFASIELITKSVARDVEDGTTLNVASYLRRHAPGESVVLPRELIDYAKTSVR